MSEETISEEQVLHNKLSFEINQELIHLMKRIIETQQENIKLKSVLKEIREYINKMEFDEYGVFYDNGKNLFVYEPNFQDKALEIIDKGIGEDK